MLTKWAKEIMMSRTSSNSSPLPQASYPSLSDQKATIAAKKHDGSSIFITPFLYGGFSTTLSTVAAMYSVAIYVGSDDTPATDEDYTLGNVISTVSGTASSFYLQDSDGNMEICIDLTIRNTSSAEISIKEIGYTCEAYISNTEGGTPVYSDRAVILMDRTVLGTSMNIAAGDSGVLRYKFKYPASE